MEVGELSGGAPEFGNEGEPNGDKTEDDRVDELNEGGPSGGEPEDGLFRIRFLYKKAMKCTA